MIRPSSRLRAISVAALVGCASAALPMQAFAEPSSSTIATVKSLVVEGRKLRDAGNHAAARTKFAEAWALLPTPIIGLDLGREEIAVRQLLEARARLLEVVALPTNPKESDESKAARSEAARLAAELQERIPTLSIAVEGAPKGAKVRVTVDGEEVPAAALSVPRKLNPGDHFVVGRLGADEREVPITLSERDAKVATIRFTEKQAPPKKEPPVEAPPVVKAPVPPPPIEAPPSASEPPPPKAERETTGVSPLVYGGFVVAGAGIVVGSITGLLAMNKATALKDGCLPDNTCSASLRDSYDSSRTFGNVATVSFVVGLVGLGVGLGGLALGSSEPAKPSASASVNVWVGVGSVGVRGAF